MKDYGINGDHGAFYGLPPAAAVEGSLEDQFKEYKIPTAGVILHYREQMVGVVLPVPPDPTDSPQLKRHAVLSLTGDIMGIEVQLPSAPGFGPSAGAVPGTVLDFGALPIEIKGQPTEEVAVMATTDPAWVLKLDLPGTVTTYGRWDRNPTYDRPLDSDTLTEWAVEGLAHGLELRDKRDAQDDAQRSVLFDKLERRTSAAAQGDNVLPLHSPSSAREPGAALSAGDKVGAVTTAAGTGPMGGAQASKVTERRTLTNT